jgi:thioredoxin reductase (NADPH)
MDVEAHEEAEKYLVSAHADKSNLPLVILKDGTCLNDPSLSELAARVGLQQKATQEMYDVLIIGGGRPVWPHPSTAPAKD